MASKKTRLSVELAPRNRHRLLVNGVQLEGVADISIRRPTQRRSIDGWVTSEKSGELEVVITIPIRFVDVVTVDVDGKITHGQS